MVEERDFIFYVFFFVMTAGEGYKKTKPATTKKQRNQSCGQNIKALLGAKLPSIKTLLLIKQNHKFIQRRITKIKPCKRRKQTSKQSA